MLKILTDRIIKQRNEKIIRFIQVGANDGIVGDPIRPVIKKEWIGVLIEPNPKCFQLLQNNYHDFPLLSFENIAIHDTLKNIKMYIPKKHSKSQIASIFRNGSLRTKNKNPLSLISKKKINIINVKCDTIDNIIEKYAIQPLDALVIDAEGADHIVLNSITLEKNQPLIIQYEHLHLSKQDYINTKNKLKFFGYKLRFGRVNATAIHQTIQIDSD